jgi:cytochrome o ubiquinol oxidase subunit II
MRFNLSVVILVIAVALCGCTGGVLDPKGPIAFSERQILFNATGIMLAIVIPVMLATLGVAFWFRASNGRARYQPDFKESGRIEILIWSIPLMTILLVGTVAWISAYDLDPPRPLVSSVKTVKVQAVALDWKWLFIYPEEGVASVNRLVIPVGAPVRFELTSSGVMNSFFVPQLAGQIYTMAGMVTYLNLLADYSGTYRGMSANFSGDGFSDMHFNVDAVPPESFAEWTVSTRNVGAVLDAEAYADLVKPSSAVAPFTFRSVVPGLFTGIINAVSKSDEGLCVTYPESKRAER